MLPQWHVRAPGHFARSAGGGRLHRNTHTPLDPSKSEWADYAVQAECRNLAIRENELTHNSSGKTLPQSSQLAEPLRTDPGLKKKVDLVCALKNRKCRRGMTRQTFPPKSSQATKKSPPPNETEAGTLCHEDKNKQ